MLRASPLLAVPALFLLAACPGDRGDFVEGENAYEGDDPGECSDGADNDQDGQFDCDDEDCEGSDDCDEPEEATGDDTGA